MIVNVEVRVDNDFEFEKALKRFNKKVKRSNILKELSDRMFFKTRSQKKRDKLLRNRFITAKLSDKFNRP